MKYSVETCGGCCVCNDVVVQVKSSKVSERKVYE